MLWNFCVRCIHLGSSSPSSLKSDVFIPRNILCSEIYLARPLFSLLVLTLAFCCCCCCIFLFQLCFFYATYGWVLLLKNLTQKSLFSLMCRPFTFSLVLPWLKSIFPFSYLLLDELNAFMIPLYLLCCSISYRPVVYIVHVFKLLLLSDTVALRMPCTNLPQCPSRCPSTSVLLLSSLVLLCTL